MKISVFQADKGDCLLLSSAGGTHILVDGGISSSYTEHVAPTLGRLRSQGIALDLVCVSHIDQDHIAGILRLLNDEVDWRVHEFQRASGNRRHKRPSSKRPAAVKALWHNAFRDQIELNNVGLDELLVASIRASLLQDDSRELAGQLDDLVTSKKQALQLVHRASAQQLDIPVNEPANGGLMYVGRPGGSTTLGDLKVTVIGPLESELERLRKEWNGWIKNSQETIRKIRVRAREEAELLNSDEGATFNAALYRLANELGNRNNVTTPNLASLMLLVEEGDVRILLPGDGHSDDIIKGLETVGLLSDGQTLHVDVLKVQHHGSEYNTRPDFWRRVTADHYIFCGNGAHQNPDLGILQSLIDNRPDLGATYRLWFNSSSDIEGSKKDRQHMRKVEQLIEASDRSQPDRLNYRFLHQGSKLSFAL